MGKLNDIFTEYGKKLLAEFKSTEGFEHHGLAGSAREQHLRAFLTDHLPKKYGLARVEVISHFQEVSQEIDIVIYDSLHCMPFLMSKSEDAAVLPIKNVCAAIQVAKYLDKRKFQEDAKKITSVKRLVLPHEKVFIATPTPYLYVEEPAPIPYGIIFAYSLDKRIKDFRCVEQWLQDVDKTTQPRHRVNLVCVLDRGLVYRESDNTGYKIFDSRELDGTENIFAITFDEDTLLQFFRHLMTALNRLRIRLPVTV